MVIFVLVYASAPFSGGHLNPAVTIVSPDHGVTDPLIMASQFRLHAAQGSSLAWCTWHHEPLALHLDVLAAA